MKYKYLTLFFSILVIAFTLYLINLLDQNEKEEIEEINKKNLEMIYTSYVSIFNTFKITAQVHNLKISKNKKVLKILEKFKDEKKEEKKDALRGELYRLLHKDYKILKNLGIRQFHFHTHKGESLLRFHRPYLSGDSLIDIRESIKFVNTKLKPFYGFEGGRIYPGFRYVFPIIKKGEHLGSVEFSLPFDSIEKELNNVLPKIAYQLHLSKKVSHDKVFERSREFFRKSPLVKNHYIENEKISKLEEKISNNKQVKFFYKNLKAIDIQKDIFSKYFIKKSKGYKADFISIKDANNKHKAFLTAYSYFDELITIKNRYKEYKSFILLATFLILVLFYIIYEQLSKLKIQKDNFEKVLNYQKNIVIQTSNHKLIYANKSFYEFTGFKNLKDFLKKHDCICDLFVENDKFFYVEKNSEEKPWVEKIVALPQHKQIVGLLGPDFQIHAFSVKVSEYFDDNYILSFFDITHNLKEQLRIENKSFHDSLTNAYNREYFQTNKKALINEYTQNTNFAIAILDIDYFKKVNDTFGHNIGDQVLIEFVKIVQKYSRKEDTLIRWGGEEFILLLKVKSKEDLSQALENIRKYIELYSFNYIGQKTCSIGATLYLEGEDIKKSIKRADEALYNAKASGRNKVILNIKEEENELKN